MSKLEAFIWYIILTVSLFLFLYSIVQAFFGLPWYWAPIFFAVAFGVLNHFGSRLRKLGLK